jgi:hypothetical protein
LFLPSFSCYLSFFSSFFLSIYTSCLPSSFFRINGGSVLCVEKYYKYGSTSFKLPWSILCNCGDHYKNTFRFVGSTWRDKLSPSWINDLFYNPSFGFISDGILSLNEVFVYISTQKENCIHKYCILTLKSSRTFGILHIHSCFWISSLNHSVDLLFLVL